MRERIKVVPDSGGPSLTKQSQADGCDINLIMKRHRRQGATAAAAFPGTAKAPFYGDFSGTLDYHQARNHLIDADNDFMRLPARVRKHCDNDPGRFLDLCADPERRDEMIELGLLPKDVPHVEEKPKVEVPPKEPES